MAESTIVDITGQPFALPDLSEQQTDSDLNMLMLNQHQSGHPASGLTLNRIAEILKEAENGNLLRQSELAEDMLEKDTHLYSEVQKRTLAMQSVPWNIVPPRNASAAEQRDAEMIEEILRDATWLNDAVQDCGDATMKGFSNLELNWQYGDKTHYVAGADWRDPAWFQAHPDNKNELRLRDGSHEGAALKPFGWISHQSRAKSGYITRRGLVRVLVWPFLFKNYSIRDLAEFLEIYGIPIRIGKYPSGANTTEKALLKRAVQSIGHNAGGVVPQGMAIEILEAAKGTDGPYMAMINWAEKSQSKAILGGTLTSQADGKSSTNALGSVHNEVRHEIRDADLQALQNTLTRDLVYPMYVMNGKSFTSPHRIPRFEFDTTQPEDLAAFADVLAIVDRGLDVAIDPLYERFKIPKPKPGEAVLSRAQQPASPDTTSLKTTSLKKSGVGVVALNATEPDPLAPLTEELHTQAMAGTDLILDQIQQIVNTADSFDDMQNKLIALQPDASQLADTLTEALTIASLSGRYDILQDAQT